MPFNSERPDSTPTIVSPRTDSMKNSGTPNALMKGRMTGSEAASSSAPTTPPNAETV